MTERSGRFWLSLNETHDIDAHVARRYRQIATRAHRTGYLLSLMRLGAALERGDITEANLDGAVAMHRLTFMENQGGGSELPNRPPAKSPAAPEKRAAEKAPAAASGRTAEVRASIQPVERSAAQSHAAAASPPGDRAKVRSALNGLLGRQSGTNNETAP